jgi:uncharacterized protein (TIGR03084 family)
MPPDITTLLDDLAAETRDLVNLLSPLQPSAWRQPTVAAGWSISDQVSHLAFFDETATLAATDPERFLRQAQELVAKGADFTTSVAELYRTLPPADLFDWFRRARRQFLSTFAAMDPSARLPWYGPPMSAATSVTARLMETWAHGLDIADTLGVQVKPSNRLRNIAEIGFRTLHFSFDVNHLEVPNVDVRVELMAPDGSTWTWGDVAATERITGPALDFCFVVTQRRHPDDTTLVATGPVAAKWLTIAQAFAGPPGAGRARRRESQGRLPPGTSP